MNLGFCHIWIIEYFRMYFVYIWKIVYISFYHTSIGCSFWRWSWICNCNLLSTLEWGKLPDCHKWIISALIIYHAIYYLPISCCFLKLWQNYGFMNTGNGHSDGYFSLKLKVLRVFHSHFIHQVNWIEKQFSGSFCWTFNAFTSFASWKLYIK